MIVKKPRISTLIIIAQFILLLVSLGFLGFFIIRSWVLGVEAKDFAYQAGFEQARRNYLRHDYSVYQMKLYTYGDDTGPIPYDGMTEPTEKMDGQFQVRYFLVDEGSFKDYREIQQRFIDGYNTQMRAYFDNPKAYDKNGFLIPMHELHPRTNTLDSAK